MEDFQDKINTLVIEHVGILSRLDTNVHDIKKAIGNGLTKELKDTRELLFKVKEECNKTCALREIEESKNWFLKLLQKNATKVASGMIGFALLIIIGVTVSWMGIKAYAWKELPGQQATIAKESKDIQQHFYHFHKLENGQTIYHTGDPNEKAYIENPVTKVLEPAPQYRTEENIK